MYGKSNMETYITICKIDSQTGTSCMAQETQTGFLYQSREMVPKNLSAGQRWRNRQRIDLWTQGEGRRG